MPTDETPGRVAARAAIVDLLTRYGRAVDSKDEVLLRSCFADEIGYEATSVGPMQALFEGRPPGLSADRFVGSVIANMRAKGATQHLIGNHTFTFHDDHRAEVTAALRAIHFAPGRPTAAPYEVGGYYRHDVVADASGWRIAFWRIEITWEFGDFLVVYPPGPAAG
jgi:hypothetical protein